MAGETSSSEENTSRNRSIRAQSAASAAPSTPAIAPSFPNILLPTTVAPENQFISPTDLHRPSQFPPAAFPNDTPSLFPATEFDSNTGIGGEDLVFDDFINPHVYQADPQPVGGLNLLSSVDNAGEHQTTDDFDFPTTSGGASQYLVAQYNEMTGSDIMPTSQQPAPPVFGQPEQHTFQSPEQGRPQHFTAPLAVMQTNQPSAVMQNPQALIRGSQQPALPMQLSPPQLLSLPELHARQNQLFTEMMFIGSQIQMHQAATNTSNMAGPQAAAYGGHLTPGTGMQAAQASTVTLQRGSSRRPAPSHDSGLPSLPTARNIQPVHPSQVLHQGQTGPQRALLNVNQPQAPATTYQAPIHLRGIVLNRSELMYQNEDAAREALRTEFRLPVESDEPDDLEEWKSKLPEIIAMWMRCFNQPKQETPAAGTDTGKAAAINTDRKAFDFATIRMGEIASRTRSQAAGDRAAQSYLECRLWDLLLKTVDQHENGCTDIGVFAKSWSADTSLKFSERCARMGEAMRQSAQIRQDIIKTERLIQLGVAPDQSLERKVTNAKQNNKRVADPKTPGARKTKKQKTAFGAGQGQTGNTGFSLPPFPAQRQDDPSESDDFVPQEEDDADEDDDDSPSKHRRMS